MTPRDQRDYDLMKAAPGYMLAKVLKVLPESATNPEQDALLVLLADGIRQLLEARQRLATKNQALIPTCPRSAPG